MIRRIAVIAILIIGSTVLSGFSQFNWSTAGLEGGVIKSMCIKSDGVLYAGTQRGVYISIDLGSSWFKGNSNLDQFGINSVIFVNFMVFAVTDNGDFYVSYDNGYNFSLRSSGYNFKTLCTFNQTIYAGLGSSSNNSGIIRTTNFGVNWMQTNLPGDIIVNEIITDDVALYAATNNGVYISSPVDTSWTKYDNGIPADTKVFSLKKSGLVILAATNRGIYRSADNGSSWNPANNGLTTGIPFFAVTIQGANAYTCQFGKGVYKSSNYGDNWFPVQNGLKDNMISCFGVYNSYLFAGSAGGGMYLTVDNGVSWFTKNTGIEAHTVHAMHNIGSTMYIGTQGGGVFRSLNGNWAASNDQLENTVVYCFAEAGGYLFSGTYGGVFRTVSGVPWEAVNSGLADSVVLSLNYNGSYLFAGTLNGGIYRSSNLGAMWTKLSGIILNDTVFSLANIGSVVYASTKRNGFVKSLDNGDTWQAINAGFYEPPHTLSLAVLNNNELYSGVFFSTVFNGVFKFNTFNTWQWISNPINEPCYFVYTFLNNIVASFYNYNGGTIRLSTNHGANWTLISPYTSNWGKNSDVKCLRAFETHLYAGTTRKSLWRIPLSQIVSTETISEVLPKDFKLGQNYPNPFNPVTNIPFELKESSHVLLKVYDVNGRLVKELINENRGAGKYIADFDGSGFSSGVYFYRIAAHGTTNNFTQTKNMLLLK
ncbi:MAG: T9SS type A sorting domain-containing protein [Candidatus Kapaibacterium sp.]